MRKLNNKEMNIFISFSAASNIYEIQRVFKISKEDIKDIICQYRDNKKPVIGYDKKLVFDIISKFLSKDYTIQEIAEAVGIGDAFVTAILLRYNYLVFENHHRSPNINITTKIIEIFKEKYCKVGDKYRVKAPYIQYYDTSIGPPETLDVTILKKYKNYAFTDNGGINYIDIYRGKKLK